jgi:hypothetical protein
VARTRSTYEQLQQQQLEYDVDDGESGDVEQIATKRSKNNNQTSYAIPVYGVSGYHG